MVPELLNPELLTTEIDYYRDVLGSLCKNMIPGRNRSQSFQAYNIMKADLEDSGLGKDEIEFGASLVGWVCGDDVIDDALLRLLEKKNIAFINKNGLRTVLFLGSKKGDLEDLSPSEISLTHLIFLGLVNYGIDISVTRTKVLPKLVFWTSESDESKLRGMNVTVIKPPNF